jgi:hypothetical protein
MPVHVWWYALFFQIFISHKTIDIRHLFKSSVELLGAKIKREEQNFSFFLAILVFDQGPHFETLDQPFL